MGLVITVVMVAIFAAALRSLATHEPQKSLNAEWEDHEVRAKQLECDYFPSDAVPTIFDHEARPLEIIIVTAAVVPMPESQWYRIALRSNAASEWSEPFLSRERAREIIQKHYLAGTIAPEAKPILLEEIRYTRLYDALHDDEDVLTDYADQCPSAAYVRYRIENHSLVADYVIDGINGPKRVYHSKPLSLPA